LEFYVSDLRFIGLDVRDELIVIRIDGWVAYYTGRRDDG
jgi:hypothetical protein